MNSISRAWLGAMLSTVCTVAIPSDPASLRGCWRSQQVEITRGDGIRYQQNGDCVMVFDELSTRGRCHGSNGDTETVSRIEPSGPGRLRVVPIDPATQQPKGPASELRYRVDDDWLLIERDIPAAANAGSNGKVPVSMRSVSIRDGGGTDGLEACRPRGDSSLRVGRLPTSSLMLQVPDGWRPWLVDPTTDKNLGPAINSNFLVGAFVQRDATVAPTGPQRFVLVQDDTRYGPLPVRAPQFVDVKKRFAKEMEPGQIVCDEPDRVCASLRMPNGAMTYTELVNLKGRVAMVTVASSVDSLADLRRHAKPFVERLRSANR